MLIPAIAGATAMALVGGMGYATAMHKNDVTLTVDGAVMALQVREDTVDEVLGAQGIELGKHDVVMPSKDAEVVDGLEITVLHARPLTVSVDGESREVWTTADTVDEALGYLDLDAKDSKLSASRSTPIGREGLAVDITTAKDVTLVTAGKETPVRLAGTVGDVLRKSLIMPDDNDKLSIKPETELADGMRIEFTQVDVATSTKHKSIPFEKKTVKSDKLEKGKTEVTTKGKNGTLKETFANVYHDGKLVSSDKKSEEVVTKPVTEVTTVGTYVKPEPKPEPKSEPTRESKSEAKPTPKKESSSTPRRSGGKYDWMRAAGIPESQWQYVDYIVSKESGWNPSARNPSSGACGLVQALPCSKLGSNWRDPVHALKWQYSYVNARYGGYAGAYSFWKRNHWY